MKRVATREALLAGLRKLFKEGNFDPSQDLVVETVGGSKATIGREMRQNVAEIALLRQEMIAQPSGVRDSAIAFGEQVWIAADAERRLKESIDALRFDRILDDTHARLDQQFEANTLLAQAVDEQNLQLTELGLELAQARSELTQLRASETALRHRADTAEASAQAKTDLIAVLREIGVRMPPFNEMAHTSNVTDTDSVGASEAKRDENAPPRNVISGRSLSDQRDMEDYLIATGKTDRVDGG